MSTLTTLSPEASDAVKVLWGKLNDKKGWTIDTVKDIYASYPAVTPEHLVVGVTNKQNEGFIYAAWAVHKNLIDAGMVNINWMSANHSRLVFDSTLGAQITAIKEGDKAATAVERDASIQDGSYTVEGLATLESAFTLAAKLPMSSNKAVGDKLAVLRQQLDALESKYATAVALSI